MSLLAVILVFAMTTNTYASTTKLYTSPYTSAFGYVKYGLYAGGGTAPAYSFMYTTRVSKLQSSSTEVKTVIVLTVKGTGTQVGYDEYENYTGGLTATYNYDLTHHSGYKIKTFVAYGCHSATDSSAVAYYTSNEYNYDADH